MSRSEWNWLAKWQDASIITSMAKIIETFRKAVKASGKSQAVLARESGVTEGQLSRLMSGERGLGADNLEKLADALGLKITVAPKTQRKSR
jgi:transcriptional regulator with XRE-family HTH domain